MVATDSPITNILNQPHDPKQRKRLGLVSITTLVLIAVPTILGAIFFTYNPGSGDITRGQLVLQVVHLWWLLCVLALSVLALAWIWHLRRALKPVQRRVFGTVILIIAVLASVQPVWNLTAGGYSMIVRAWECPASVSFGDNLDSADVLEERGCVRVSPPSITVSSIIPTGASTNDEERTLRLRPDGRYRAAYSFTVPENVGSLVAYHSSEVGEEFNGFNWMPNPSAAGSRTGLSVEIDNGDIVIDLVFFAIE